MTKKIRSDTNTKKAQNYLKKIIRLNTNIAKTQDYLTTIKNDIDNTTDHDDRTYLQELYKFMETLLETLLKEKTEAENNQNYYDDDDEDDNDLIQVTLM